VWHVLTLLHIIINHSPNFLFTSLLHGKVSFGLAIYLPTYLRYHAAARLPVSYAHHQCFQLVGPSLSPPFTVAFVTPLDICTQMLLASYRRVR
jgi:hypothetical protein